ncbi:hypothetical protein [Lentzea indica]|nr:hypothetical protein [Lentzea indica]
MRHDAAPSLRAVGHRCGDKAFVHRHEVRALTFAQDEDLVAG